MEFFDNPRSALSRAYLFLEKADATTAAERNDFEAFLEASIIFARAAIHRFKTEHGGHPLFNQWWASLAANPTIRFFRDERDFILKEGPAKIGQKLYAGFFDASKNLTISGNVPTKASGYYFYDDLDKQANTTVRNHLTKLKALLTNAHRDFQ